MSKQHNIQHSQYSIANEIGVLNMDRIRREIQQAWSEGVKEAERTGSDVVVLKHSTPYTQFIEWGTKKK